MEEVPVKLWVKDSAKLFTEMSEGKGDPSSVCTSNIADFFR